MHFASVGALSVGMMASAASALSINARQSSSNSSAPLATTKNGTYYGEHQPDLHQDYWQGIPYAQAPVGSLRFRPPQPLNESWTGERNATELGAMCMGFGTTQTVLGHQSEDCLTLNVFRPSNVSDIDENPLPVAVFIHGGLFKNGGSRDPRYNMTAMLQDSVEMGKYFVAVTLNYRLSYWGWLYSQEVADEGSTNVGLRDQRLALQWIQENIGAFGGDPDKVTIWGQEAGGFSVGLHTQAYGGRDDGLFRAAIGQSGNPTLMWQSKTVEDAQPIYDAIVDAVGCSSDDDSLACLRNADADTLNTAFNSADVGTDLDRVNPVVDGDIVRDTGANALRDGAFVKVPYMLGANFDEGTWRYYGAEGINTTEQFKGFVENDGLNSSVSARVAELYPDDPAVGIPATLEGRPSNTSDGVGTYGWQWKRVCAYAGDKVMHAGRRLASREMAAQGVDVWTYHWNVLLHAKGYMTGAQQFDEVGFVWHNITLSEEIYPTDQADQKDTFEPLSRLMSRMWISFVTTLDPNNHGLDNTTAWPKYSVDNATNYVFDVNATTLAYVEEDNFRADGISYIIDLMYGDLAK